MMQAFQHHSRVRLGLLGIDMTAAVDPRHLSLRLRIESFSSPVGVDHLRWNGQMVPICRKYGRKIQTIQVEPTRSILSL
jgi:hypothetical protein